MVRLIFKAPYYKPNARTQTGGTRSGYAKYIATREGVELLPRSGMTEYIGERKGSNGLFTDKGTDINLSAIMKEIDEYKGNVWGLIFSLTREDAERLGYNSATQWMNLLRSRRNDIAKEMHIAPANLRWYVAYHNKEDHPHVHMLVWSANPIEAYQIGRIYLEDGDTKNAIPFLERAASQSHWARTQLGLLCYYQLGEEEKGWDYISEEAMRYHYKPAEKAWNAIGDGLNAQIVIGICDLLYYAGNMLLHEAMEMAVHERIIIKNPTVGTVIPKANRKPINPFNNEQLDKFLSAIKDEPEWHDLFYMEVTTGLRRGEICGLKWGDFDGRTGTVKVTRTIAPTSHGLFHIGDTKTESGMRTIFLAPSTLEILKERQTKAMSEWIFPNFFLPELPINPNTAYTKFKSILKRYELPDIRFHDLRHTFASMSLDGGIDIKTLADILGHRTVKTTLDIYSHVTEDMQRSAAMKIDRAVTHTEPRVEPQTEGQANTQPPQEKPKFEPYKGKIRKRGTGYVKQLSANCWQGRYTPTIDGKRVSHNIYAKTEDECKLKLANLIQKVKSEHTAKKQ